MLVEGREPVLIFLLHDPAYPLLNLVFYLKLYLCFVLHNYCKNKKENLPKQNRISALSFKKRSQPSTSFLSYGEKVNENKAISIINTFILYFE